MVYLGLGSNIDNKEENLRKALVAISERVGEIAKISSMYETEAWGYESDNRYMNMAIALETDLCLEALLAEIKDIEKKLGRKEKTTNSYEDRPIDIDILFYDNLIFTSEKLSIPHPHIAARKFVLAPMAEIASEFVHPVLQKKMKELDEAIGK